MGLGKDINRFIVPIYTLDDNQGLYFNGTGFVIGDYLITAGHVSHDEGDLFVVYDDCKYKLQNPIYEEYCKTDDGVKHDLTLYKVDFVKSPLKLCINEFSGKIYGELLGYSFNDEEKKICVDRVMVRINNFAYCYSYVHPLKLLNCYSFSPAVGQKGNSGCPVINDKNEVVGMFIGIFGQNPKAVEGIIIKAAYIQEVIDDYIRSKDSINE